MTDTFRYSCKQCGSQNFKTATEPQSVDDFVGAVCTDCGRVATEDDIRESLGNHAADIARGIFGDFLE